MTHDIPGAPAEITASWLSDALDTPVRDCRIAGSHEGTTGRAVIELEHDGSAGLPNRLFVKLRPSTPDQQAFVLESGMGKREARFYRTLSGELPVRTPHCYHSDWDDSGERYIMLLEHLEDSGCRFRPAGQYSLDWVKAVVCAFAALHAKYWQSPRFETDLAWLDQPPRNSDIGLRLVRSALDSYREQLPPIFTDLAELYLDRSEAIHRLWLEGPATIHHGDPHDGNQFLDGERPGFLDWGVVARGPGMRDVGYFVSSSLRPEHRDEARGLIALYREQLQLHGVEAPPTLDELWQQYQWHALYVWLSCATTLGAGETFQPSKFVLAALKRLHPTLEAQDVPSAVTAALR